MIAVCHEHNAGVEQRQNRGYTILELMLAVAILAIVAGFAVPSFLSSIQSNRLVTINNEMISALTLARSEAIKRASRVTVCPTADQATCLAGGAWESGWLVFVDPTGVGAVDPGEQILRVWEAAPGGTTIRAGGSFSDFVSFVPSGETRATPNNSDIFNVCDEDGATADGRTITVGLIGYAKTQKGALACP